MIWAARRANSAGWPNRWGKRVWASRRSRVGSGMVAARGVSIKPGTMVQTRTPTGARSRAAGSVRATTPPLGGGMGALAGLAVVARHRGRVDHDAPLPVAVGRQPGHGRGGDPQN